MLFQTLFAFLNATQKETAIANVPNDFVADAAKQAVEQLEESRSSHADLEDETWSLTARWQTNRGTERSKLVFVGMLLKTEDLVLLGHRTHTVHTLYTHRAHTVHTPPPPPEDKAIISRLPRKAFPGKRWLYFSSCGILAFVVYLGESFHRVQPQTV